MIYASLNGGMYGQSTSYIVHTVLKVPEAREHALLKLVSLSADLSIVSSWFRNIHRHLTRPLVGVVIGTLLQSPPIVARY